MEVSWWMIGAFGLTLGLCCWGSGTASHYLAQDPQSESTSSLTHPLLLLREVAPVTNCIYELLPARAIARAKELDEYFAEHGKPLGPVHGLPISIKAHIGPEGRENPVGFVGWVGRKNVEDANVVKIHLEAGAVVYARTTEAQGPMALETHSNLFGTTTNPHNTATSAGGSSGEELALLALRGSPLGIGIRGPAANCGLYGLKPSTDRLPIIGLSAYVLGCGTILGTIGPMSSTLGGLEIFMKTVLRSKPWLSDPLLHPIPWRDDEPHIHQDGKKLTVGVMWTDGVVNPVPAVTRALREVEEALEILTKIYAPHGGDAFKRHLGSSGEPYNSLTAWTTRDAPGVEKLSFQGVWDWKFKCDVFRYRYMQGISITLSPQRWTSFSAPCTQRLPPYMKHLNTGDWGYTSLWNLLDYSAVSFPVTKIDPGENAKDTLYTPRNEFDSWVQEHYDPKKQRDIPVCLQLVAKRLEEEKLFQALREIKDSVGVPFKDCLA
ncbi:glutamyl-tRNA amidotransferase subunit A [Aspergillus cavernicola]|uniref:Glutamyl-tRNA amidotransferase subunit A n=1 Tax=Aspergillus cavernicola TaxID=176166 RepID=A0ABR4HM64_9EURO